MVDARTGEENAREFAARFAAGAFADATDLLTENGHAAVVDSFPFDVEDGATDAEDALEQYWWGLRGQYGDIDGVREIRVRDGEATVTFSFEDGTETATLGLDDGRVSDVSFAPSYDPPTYANEDAFTERDVTIDAGDVSLGGVLAVPDANHRVPGVLLVHGAGVHDPDGTADNAKLLKDIAWGLATDGIASLRYEKRLADHDVPDDELTLDAVVTDDAVAAADRLAAVDEVDEDALFVAGHSQGGTAAPRIADRHGNIRGVVNFDGAPDPGALPPEHADVIRYEFDIAGDLDEEQAAQLAEDRETLRRIADGEFEDDEILMGRPGVWHRSLREYDPVATVNRVDVPLLALVTNGADEGTQPELAAFFRDNYEGWRDADLPDGSRVESYRGVNHYFQSVSPPTNTLTFYFAGNVVEDAIVDAAEWIHDTGER